MPVIQAIVDQHAEEAAFLWLLRDAAASAPNYTLAELGALDERVEAHLDGLRIAGDAGWAAVATNLSSGGPGELFAAAVLALEATDGDRLREVLAALRKQPELARPVVAAFAWLPPEHARQRLEPLLAAEPPLERVVGLRAAAAHRLGDCLDRFVQRPDPDAAVRIAVLRGLAECGRTDQRGYVALAQRSEDYTEQFWACWSAALLGDPSGADVLQDAVLREHPASARALEVLARTLPREAALFWQRNLAASAPRHRRLAIELSGLLGEATAVPWLLAQMSDASLTRIAGEAFARITGCDLADDGLEARTRPAHESGPSDDPADTAVALDPDAELLWPDPTRVADWWHGHASEFRGSGRYLGGQSVDARTLETRLRTASQRERAAVALDLKLRAPERPLFETRARASHQRKLLGSGTTLP